MSLNFGYSYNRLNNFDQSGNIKGVSNSSSMADFWAALGNGTNYHDLEDAEAIAFDSYVLDTLTGTGGNQYGTVYSNYGDNPPSKYGQTVTRLISNEGYTGEHAFSVGGNYNNKLFFGGTIGITRLRYTGHFSHSESTDVALPSLFKEFTYTDHIEDKGTGYSIKLGAIFKPVEAVRIGLAFHSPTWFRIDRYFYKDITSQFTDGFKYESSNTPSRFNYALATPFRLLAGIGVQVQKHALLSADYEFVDYTSASFSETGDGFDYSEKNDAIKNSLKPASNIRVGAEFRFNTIYLRGGYGLYGKTFASGEDNANLNYNAISFGAGFREQNVSVDFGFSNLKYSQKYFLYPVNNGVDLAQVNMNSTRNIFTLTLGYKFGM
jgi:long-subunit fatty acid transport protein